MNNAQKIERLVQATVRDEAAKKPMRYFGEAAEPLVAKPAQPGFITKAQEKIQPTNLETGGGVKFPLTEDGSKREFHAQRTFTDSSRLLLYIVKPVKKLVMMTADAVPKEMVFIFAEPTS